MNAISNKQVICEVLEQAAKNDCDILVLCSDSRGSGSMTPFFQHFPQQSIELGIAEQNLVSVSAGLASCMKRPFVVAPACFLSARSYEQIKIDVAYSDFNVKLIGISGGISYGALGYSHHSTQDIACIGALTNMRVYIPSDRHVTKLVTQALIKDNKPAYIRVGRNASEDVYKELSDFCMDKAITVREGLDITIITCGDLVSEAVKAADELKKMGISCRVLDMYCIKPIDKEAILMAAKETRAIIVAEEHSIFGGLCSMVSQLISTKYPIKIKALALPDTNLIAGKQQEVLSHYGIDANGMKNAAMELLGR